jgi:addiction module HigA family antidote
MARNPVHPGEILGDELMELGITPTELARQLHVPHNRITQLLQGKRAVTGDTALRLGHWFGTSPVFWMNLQSLYDVAIAERENGAEVARLPHRSVENLSRR